MIRKLRKEDVDAAAHIWLDTNIKAHYFVPSQYWESNFKTVKEMLPQAEVYVYDNGEEIQGFIGVRGGHVEGLFVSDEMQSHGIGKLLLDHIKSKKNTLSLNAYLENARAIHFYKREGFEVERETVDEATGEKEYIMTWSQK